VTLPRLPPDAVLWEEGMALAPQHLQQMVLRADQLVAYQAALHAPFHWGVLHMALDMDVLPEGLLRVRELEAMMPDGLPLQHRDGGDRPLELDLRPFQDPAGRGAVTVHLAVAGGRAVAPADGGGLPGGELPRYGAAESAEVVDEAGGALPVTMRRLRPLLNLEVTTAPRQRPPARFISMPLARITHDGRVFQLTSFVPPAPVVADRSPLWREVQDMLRRGRERAHHISRRASARDTSSTSRLEMEGLAAGLPALEALLASGRAHPFSLYVELCRYLGLLSALAVGEVPQAPPRYDHDDPLLAYAEVLAAIERVMQRTQRSYVPVPFVQEGEKFTLLLEPAWGARRLLVGLRGAPGQSEASLVGWMEYALIATSDRVQDLWNMRVRGAARRVVAPDAEIGLAIPAGMVVFLIEQDSAYITSGKTLEVSNVDARAAESRPSDILMFVQG
jgi:type VI secretion system protein ImpJ